LGTFQTNSKELDEKEKELNEKEKLVSPWANDKIICVLPFTKEEEDDLFLEFKKQEKLEIEDGLIDEIHNYTFGYKSI
jgi:hypothetical protein